MKMEKREDGTEVVTFETRPWDKPRPCLGCPIKIGKVIAAIKQELLDISAKLEGMAMEVDEAVEEPYYCHDNADCPTLKDFEEVQEYWRERQFEVSLKKAKEKTDETNT